MPQPKKKRKTKQQGLGSASKDGLVFHKQVRVGKGEKGIVVSKFRKINRGENIRLETGKRASEDPRLTRVGRVLDKTHIDELPQVMSVLKKEMLPVGIRTRLRIDYQRLPPEVREIYKEIGPGAWPIELACKNFPPSKKDLIETAREFHKIWKKNKRRAYILFFLRGLRNVFRKERMDENL